MRAIYGFEHDHGVPARQLGWLLGGKGAGLAEMTSLGFGVPPGFTISVPMCREYLLGGWPSALDGELKDHVERLGEVMGRRLGDVNDPLLVAVRSGAPLSMPGMLDTVLNLGLNDETVVGLARRSGGEWFAWDTYRRFLAMFSTTVMGLAEPSLELENPADTAHGLQGQVARLANRIERLCGRPVPHDPAQQLREAVKAVFRSWGGERARAYRQREGIDENLGTAVNVQAMVFGNRGTASGTGVVFSRDPASGEPRLYGDYLPLAQGEDVVAGTARTLPIDHLGEHQPDAYAQLKAGVRRLEHHYQDLCDIEFTVEDGQLWLLQTRIGKRGPVAAARIAVDLVDDPDIALSEQEAVDRVPQAVRAKARAEVAARAGADGAVEDLMATGLGASPGRASGRVVRTAEDALEADDDVILVRRETSPEEVAGMAASVGVLTTRGGLVSHAAVVARGWGVPAVVGAEELDFSDSRVSSSNGLAVAAGETITIDGTTGRVWRGEHRAEVGGEDTVNEHLPHLTRLERWAQEREGAPA